MGKIGRSYRIYRKSRYPKKLKETDLIKYVDIDSIDNHNFEIRDYKEKTVGELSSRARRVLKKDYIINLYKDLMQGFNSPSINNQQFDNTLIPLPPLKEQEEIVNKIETLLAKVTPLESQIQERKSLSDKLIFGIIKENLEG